ncbi:hypothetical protein [uncultured Rhodoblastus sp.]|uniref:hypothetical protein n=1 Tax=uncultured Rhodoblastus sp. TaxID=543037 RepID=UPI0025F33405|nr:hypothetical protein [uncultured Rhodoblastus sp.]
MRARDTILKNIKAALPGSFPSLRIEVFSPDNLDLAAFSRWSEHRRTAEVDHIIVVESLEPLVMLWWRDDAGEWVEKSIRALDAKVELPKLGIALRMDAIYKDVIPPTLSVAFNTAAILPNVIGSGLDKLEDGSPQTRTVQQIIDRILETIDAVSQRIGDLLADGRFEAEMEEKKERHQKRMQES